MFTNPELAARFAKACQFLSIKNPEETLFKALGKIGIVDDEISLDMLNAGDIATGHIYSGLDGIGVNMELVPDPRLHGIRRVLCNPSNPIPYKDNRNDDLLTLFRESRPIGQRKDADLMEEYGVDCDPEIIDALLDRSHGRGFVIFDNKNEVDVKNSLKLLRRARRSETPETYRVNGQLKRVYRAGDFPSVVQYECPFHPVILFDTYCDDCKFDWEGVDYEVMQFAAVVNESGNGPVKSREIRDFIDIARKEGVEGLKDDYPDEYLRFQEMKDDEDLPNLKKRTSTASTNSDPVNVRSRKNRTY